MTERTGLLLLMLLGAGLLYVSSPAPLPPDADSHSAALSRSVDEAPAPEEKPLLDVAGLVNDEIQYAPAKAAFLETVILQGSLGERKSAIRELRSLGTPEAVQVLSVALADEDDRVRKSALAALADIGSEDALAVIASTAQSDLPADRALAAEALARSEANSAVNYLELVLDEDTDPRVRAAAVDSLGDIGDSRSIDIISRALRDPDPEVRQLAVEILDRLDDETLFHSLYPKQ